MASLERMPRRASSTVSASCAIPHSVNGVPAARLVRVAAASADAHLLALAKAVHAEVANALRRFDPRGADAAAARARLPPPDARLA
ncbi:MAG: hypothetical protein VXW27_10180, partial [Pseudomonadota bacterium]|nr:hypothetical protein [Pseudomonadota bacterium]